MSEWDDLNDALAAVDMAVEDAIERDETRRHQMAKGNCGGQEIHIGFAGVVPDDEMEAFLIAVAEVVHSFDQRTGWDPIMTATTAAAPTEDGEQP